MTYSSDVWKQIYWWTSVYRNSEVSVCIYRHVQSNRLIYGISHNTLPPSPSRATYVAVAPAVNEMLDDIRGQELAFLLHLQGARENVPKLHFAKAHCTVARCPTFVAVWRSGAGA